MLSAEERAAKYRRLLQLIARPDDFTSEHFLFYGTLKTPIRWPDYQEPSGGEYLADLGCLDWIVDFGEEEAEIRQLYEELFNVNPPLRQVVKPADFPKPLTEYVIYCVCWIIPKTLISRQLSADFELRMVLWAEFCKIPFEIWAAKENDRE